MFICCFAVRVIITFIRMMKTPVGMMGDCLRLDVVYFRMAIVVIQLFFCRELVSNKV